MQKTLEHSLEKIQIYSTGEVESILNQKFFGELGQLERKDLKNLWSSDLYGLDRLAEFQNLETEKQDKILEKMAISKLMEAYFIEKAGMSFAAKMSLCSESLNEQKLFSLFAAEEATHFHFLQTVLDGKGIDLNGNVEDPFIKLLNEVISTGERRALIFIIQVVLEGWGIDHYAGLERRCQHGQLKHQLKSILKDEAAHHGSGLSLFQISDLTKYEHEYICEMMVDFLKMVNCGPVGLVNICEENEFSFHSKYHQEIQSRLETKRKLNLLKSLMNRAKANTIIEKLDKYSLFEPCY